MQQIIEGLEEKIDPFDLDVFSPYIQSHLMKQAQRSSVSIIMDYVLHHDEKRIKMKEKMHIQIF
jgi:hypothetical protein